MNCNYCNCNRRSITVHLKSYKSTRYDISKTLLPRWRTSKRLQNASKSSSFRPQKSYKTTCFDTFPLTLRTNQRRRNSAFRPHLEGFVRQNGYLGGKSGERDTPNHTIRHASSGNITRLNAQRGQARTRNERMKE